MVDIVKPCSIVLTEANIGFYTSTSFIGADGLPRMKGLIPRNYNTHPIGCYAPYAEPFRMTIEELDKIMPESEIPDRIRQQEKDESSLQHVSERSGPNGGPIPSLDQNSQGFCWAYSTTMAVMLVRAAAGLPYKRLSGHMIGCEVKGFRDEGGWNAESLKFATEKGIASVETWKEKSMARSNENADMWADAASNKVTEFWDIDVNDRKLLRRIQAYFLLSNIPMMGDRSRWSHSTVDARLLSWSPFKIRGRNSWTDQWGDRGWFDMEGSLADVDGTNAPRVIMAA